MGRRDSKEDPQERRGLESMVAHLIRKAVLSGVDRASRAQETLEGIIGENKLPKELVSAIFSQIEDTKNGLFRAVAKEVRSFLEATDLQRELQRLLTTVSFEIRTEIRFVPNGAAPSSGAAAGGTSTSGASSSGPTTSRFGRPEVKSSVEVKRSKDRERDSLRPEQGRPSEAPRSSEPPKDFPSEPPFESAHDESSEPPAEDDELPT